jgi:hypothetical protein
MKIVKTDQKTLLTLPPHTHQILLEEYGAGLLYIHGDKNIVADVLPSNRKNINF